MELSISKFLCIYMYIQCSSDITKELFIKVSMARYSRLVIFSSGKSSVFYSHAASRLRDVYCLKRSEDLAEKIISPLIFDTNRSFKQ